MAIHKDYFIRPFFRILDGLRGFSLIELMISMAVGLMITGATYGIFISQDKQLNKQDKIVEMQQNVRAAMDMISREVRMAGYNHSRSFITGIPYHAAQLQIRADLNEDGDVLDANEDITYAYNSSKYRITRNTGGGAQPFAENIIGFTFEYLDAAGSSITLASDEAGIRQVKLIITGRTSAPINGRYQTYQLSANVYPRNLAF